MRKALFLDRDGVINIDHGYVSRVEDFEFVPGVLTFIKTAQEKGYLPIVVTNQSGIGRGYYDEADFWRLSGYMIERMQEEGIKMDKEQIFFCPHRPDEGCNCRKPKPGMLLSAKARFDIDMAQSVMIGDKESDMEAAKQAGVGRTVLVEKNKPIERKVVDEL